MSARNADRTVTKQRRDQSVTKSRFVLLPSRDKCLISKPGDVAERLKAAVC
jgi:hypothetical protein